jgi:predicted phage terminase large subunit-like protein
MSEELDVKTLLAAAREDSAIFAYAYRAGIVPAVHQYEMARRVDDDDVPYQADFWPRDHGKSEIFCMAYPLRRICEDPDVRILIVQKTAEEAQKTLGVIKTELETNDTIKAYYGGLWQQKVGTRDISNAAGVMQREGRKESAWRMDRITVKRARKGKDPTVEAVGVGGAITGGHFDVIILDDVEDDENVRTDTRRRWMLNWFSGTVMQLREPHTKMIVVGTLKTNGQDIYNALLDNPIWDCKTVSSLLSHKLNDIEYDPVYNVHGRLVDVEVTTPDVVTLWPGRWDIRTLLLDMLAAPIKSIWIREKTNNLAALAGKIFQSKWFRYISPDELPPIFTTIVQSWDTAWEEGEEDDFAVCTTVGLSLGKAYILDIFRKKLTVPALKEAIQSQYDKWRPDRILIEYAGSGKAAVQVLEVETGLPIVRVTPGGRDKIARANSVTVYFETGRVFFQSGAPWLAVLEDELVLFPDVDHDDQVDSIVYALLDIFLGTDAGEADVKSLGELMQQAADDREALLAAVSGRAQPQDTTEPGAPMARYVVMRYIGEPTMNFPITVAEHTVFVATGWSRTVERTEAARIIAAYPGHFDIERSL